MAQIVSLTASARQSTGKGAARQARFRGQIPAVIYGRGRDTQPLAVEAKALEKALTGVEPASTIIELAVDGKKVRTLIREIQRHPVRPDIIHVDFYEIHAAEKVKLKVPVHLVGAPDGVRNAGGVLDQVTREVEIEVLPEQIPDRVELDVTALKIGDSLHVRHLQIPNVTILTHSDLTIATVVPPRAEEVAAPTPEAVAEVAEPELIRKVREGEEATAGEADGVPVRVLKPITYMNRSGAALASLRADPGFNPATDLLVLVDDFQIPCGTFRLRGEGSAGGHNGLKSIEGALQSRQYARLRVGVGPLPEGADWSDYVVAPFTSEQIAQTEALMAGLVADVERRQGEAGP